MQPNEFISSQPAERQGLLSKLHALILQEDKTVTAAVSPMMGKEMIMYSDRGMMKYALASVQKHMSLHLLPMYGNADLHERYKSLLDKASFQKGCINFNNSEDIPLEIAGALIGECAKIDLVKIREDYLKAKKEKGKKG